MRITWTRLVLFLAGLALAGYLLAWSGVISIGASSGHWRITAWALHWVMQNSTRTHAFFEPAPPADLDAAMRVHRAAGHFETSCAFCHGSPLLMNPRLSAHMTPVPPYLDGTGKKWTPRQLARIIRHGVKYTGMPSWIAPQRDDEVWAMVAFLRALPKLSEAGYRDIAFGAPVPDDRVLEGCARCHGMDGGAQGGAVPVIGGQSETYLIETLRAFAKGSRHSGFMEFAVDGRSTADLERMARHYAAKPGLAETVGSGEGRGADIALKGLPEADVPACQSCHGASVKRNPAYPRLVGQDAGYIAGQLRLMKEGVRGGTPYAHIMQRIAERLPDDAIDAVAAYYSAAGGGAPAQ